MKKRILLVDDEPDILQLLKYNLEKEGYEVETATNGKEGVQVAKAVVPDLIILDVMMPVMNGIEACEEMRRTPELSSTLICFLTARSEDYSQIAGLEAGGDDYIAKPIKPKVLVSKVSSLLRRGSTAGLTVSEDEGRLQIDRERFLVIIDGKELVLPKKEFELLALLFSSPGKVFNRQEILDHVWGTDVVVGDRTIDVHIRKLREKIGEGFIRTVKGVGYSFDNTEVAA